MSEPWPDTLWLWRAVEVGLAVSWPRLFEMAVEYANPAMLEAASCVDHDEFTDPSGIVVECEPESSWS